MMKCLTALSICFLFAFNSCVEKEQSWIRINQLGYRPADVKVAVFLSKERVNIKDFSVIDAVSGKIVMTYSSVTRTNPLDPFISCYRLQFSGLKKDGLYRIKAGKAISPDFRIAEDVYEGTAGYLLNYMRQQRCGYNPFLQDSCHTMDGYEMYGTGDSAHINVTGGWHDAADYLQYVATSANAVYQMLFAWSENPDSFRDEFLANGDRGTDGLADVINESRWGLDWLIKMNPGDEVMYNQIADDRDHAGFRFPNHDSVNYGKGKERPVYLCTGQPQGLFKYKNKTTGIASTAGKFASAFAKGSKVYRNIDPKFSEFLRKKALAAFKYGLNNPGACQTAPGTAPYFYEEENWTDDMELGAIELYNLTGDQEYLKHAIDFGRREQITPWIGSDTARHYQWYPFINMGHPGIARQKKEGNTEFAGYMKKGLELINNKGFDNPFRIGVPFIWCSNNLVAGILTQSHLYQEITGDTSFIELEASHRDWLFGCNPWGTSMVVGLPANGDSPENTHSSYVVKGKQVPGGLVDGPVYSSIFNSLKFIYLSREDEYKDFQTRLAVYHDDFADYSTNECTMDGTACLVYYLSEMASGNGFPARNSNITATRGAVTRMDSTKKEIWLCFTAHEFKDGFKPILQTLKNHKIRASFFLTGDFCRQADNKNLINELVSDGHYTGPHSDKHLLYCSWEKRDSLLISKNDFLTDLSNNITELEKLGISEEETSVFMPPYEWYNDTISKWAKEAGMKMVNISSGTIVNQDWTIPVEGARYYSSDTLMKNFLGYEKKNGMNGYILLIHPGTDPRRTDKFYYKLDSVLSYLENKNYKFRSFADIR